MRRPRVVSLLVALVVATVLAGCADNGGPGSSGVEYEKLGVAVPSPSGPYQTPKPEGKPPGDNANPTQQILYDLQERVVRTAGVTAKTEASCEGGLITGTVDQTVKCSVTYQRLRVAYQVEITGGTPTFSWVATAERGVLTAEGVGRAYWAKYGRDADEVRCDKMPKARLVPLGKDTDFRCYHKRGDTWHEHGVLLNDGEIAFPVVEAG
ncbi:MAG: hypothetical protein ACRDT4_14540 [Micromonosporaceae bacterium]